MTTNLTDEEREIWKEAYRMHERVHGMKGSDDDWKAFLSDIAVQLQKHEGSAYRLAYQLSLALYDYMGEEQRIREEAARRQPEQTSILEEIPWN